MDATAVKACFERVAGEWDSMREAWYDDRVVEELARRARVNESSVVLDVGTGTGFFACGLAPRVARVIGVDHSPAILAAARRNVAALHLTNVELCEGDFGRTALDSDCVDAAVANMAPPCREPGGDDSRDGAGDSPGRWVSITDEVEHSYEWMREEHADLWLGFGEQQVAAFFAAARLEHYGYASLGMQ